VHIIDIQYFKGVKTIKNDTMHDLMAMYTKALSFCNEVYSENVDTLGNFRFSPNPSKMSDLEVIALAVIAESACIDSENFLFSKLRSDYLSQMPNLIDRTRFNRRRRALAPYILEFGKRLALTMEASSSVSLVDSMPCPIVKNSREKQFKICKENVQTAPMKGFSAVDQRYYIGYKLHLLTTADGILQDMSLTPANVHDIQFLKESSFEDVPDGTTLLGDRAYISQQMQLDLFETYQITLKVPYRKNQKKTQPYLKKFGKMRRRIETTFAQLCDQFRFKYNYAKTFAGLYVRIVSKISAISMLQKLNLINGRPLNHIKHAWVQ
jgi:hypothetical protein